MTHALFGVIGDLHLSHKRPRCRAEEDWTTTQLNYLYQVKEILSDHGNPPLVITGDMFDKWEQPLWFVNMIVDWFQGHLALPLCIAGNHDLPDHDPASLIRSAYGSLVASRSHRSPILSTLQQSLPISEEHPMGSVGLKIGCIA